MITYLLLIFGLFFLGFGGDALVSGAVSLARKLGLSSLLIGLTLVGFGTSTPELITSFIATFQGSGDIAVGNVIGSNTANILLILGVSALIRPIRIDLKPFKRDGIFLILATLAAIAAAIIGGIGPIMGVGMVALLIYYVYFSYHSDKRLQQEKKQSDEQAPYKKEAVLKSLAKTVGGIILTMIGAKLLVDNSIILARDWGISEGIIGLTIVAVGTSLPEMAASVAGSIKKHGDLAFGNIVGSNIFNILFILGLVAIFVPLGIPDGMDSDVLIMTLATAALIGIAFWRRQISRLTGLLFVTSYIIYIIYLYQVGL